MIADEIKKAGQATIEQSTDLLTYKLTDTWEIHSGSYTKLAALACDTGGRYWHDDDYGDWSITFTQDVCRYNGTPVKIYSYSIYGSGEGSRYTVTDFSGNKLYYAESVAPTDTDFTVRQIEFQNNKQSFQLLSSEHPTYTDSYDDETYYSESYLLNTYVVPKKSTLYNSWSRTKTSLPGSTRKTLNTLYAYNNCVLLMINAVISNDYNWVGATYPNANYNLILTRSDGLKRYVNFNYYNPGNAMIMLQPNQNLKIEMYCSSITSSETTNVLTTVERIGI